MFVLGIIHINMVSWWNDIQCHASMWIIRLNIKRIFCTVAPHYLNPIPQIVGIYAAVYSGSRALKGPPSIRSVLYTDLTCAFQSCRATAEQAWTNSWNIHFSFADCLISGLLRTIVPLRAFLTELLLCIFAFHCSVTDCSYLFTIC